jgi:hypothetical protein
LHRKKGKASIWQCLHLQPRKNPQTLPRLPFNCAYFLFSHAWFATVHEVLHADWHDAWHSPQPPFEAEPAKDPALIVFTCFIFSPLATLEFCGVSRCIANALPRLLFQVECPPSRKAAALLSSKRELGTCSRFSAN